MMSNEFIILLKSIYSDSKKGVENDPVKSCDFYKDKGCTHVDGLDCNMKTCGILSKYKEGKL